ncbi:MAG TPA: GyrI-like domain-containing protein [Actinocrinis sp.]|nr:GyrI-like domain-containing protein [Actinocrinis sp.]
MQTEPRIVERAEQPYVAIKARVTMQELGPKLPPLHAELFGWLGAHGAQPAGAPFWKYNVVDMERTLEVEVGIPLAAAVEGDERVLAGVLPAGRYAFSSHTGHPAELVDATGALLDWAAGHGHAWDMIDTPEGQRWAARLEFYNTDPREEPDLDKWETDLLFRLAD